MGRSSSGEGQIGWVKLPEAWELDRMLNLRLETEGRNTSRGWKGSHKLRGVHKHSLDKQQRATLGLMGKEMGKN